MSKRDIEDEKEVDKGRNGGGQIVGGWERKREQQQKER